MAVINWLMFLVPVLGVGISVYSVFLHPVLDFIGAFRILSNSDISCRAVQGLEACEASWLDAQSGLLYLGCLSIAVRQHWTPAMLLLNETAIPDVLPGYFAIYDTNTEQVTQIQLEGDLPQGIATHGFDFWVDEADEEGKRHATVFAINHRKSHSRWHTGADSVVEVFETEIGSSRWKHVKTLKDSHINTPNNIMALSDSKFYVSNDHAKRGGFYRNAAKYGLDTEFMLGWPASNIAFCDVSDKYFPCSTALNGILYPNGIERGPDQSVYVASTALGIIFRFGIQADHSLVELSTIEIKRPIDNLNVLENGNIIVPAFAKATELHGALLHGDPCPVEVWRVVNATGSGDFYGGTEHVELIFSSDGKRVSGVTDATVHKDKLYMTGIATPNLWVCDLS